VTAISVSGKFIVTFESYGNQEEVELQDVRPAQAAVEATGTGYKGVQAPKRHTVRDETGEEVEEMPKWLEIKPTGEKRYLFFACWCGYAALWTSAVPLLWQGTVGPRQCACGSGRSPSAQSYIIFCSICR